MRGKRLIGVVGLIVAVAVGVRAGAGPYLAPRPALAWIHSLDAGPWGVLLWMALYVVLTAMLVPATLLHVVSAAAWGFWPGGLLNVLTCNMAASLQFLVARRLGRERVTSLARRGRLAGLDAFAAEQGIRSVILVRLLPLPTVVVNVAGGISSIRWRSFAVGTAIGSLPVIGVYTALAAALVEGAEGVQGRAMAYVGVSSAALALSVVLPPLLRASRRRRSAPAS